MAYTKLRKQNNFRLNSNTKPLIQPKPPTKQDSNHLSHNTQGKTHACFSINIPGMVRSITRKEGATG